ncbi:MAG: hypothetical protein DRP78_00435 [Candidatus Omnitrophota bacterium]|nr:MAG: hypothetical protein DRP78_00435 [Candidatus Omnitrophota bacterium]
MTNFRFKNIGAILMDKELLTSQQLQEGLENQKISGLPLGKIFVDSGYITEQQLLEILGMQAKVEVVDLETLYIPKNVLERVPASIARMYNIIPINFEDNTLTIATSEPLNFSISDDLRFMLNCNVKAKAAIQTSISKLMKKCYGAELDTIEEIFSEISQKIPDLPDDEQKIENIEQMASELPIVKLLNFIIIQAIKKKASDIHFEPFSDEFKIRYRIDGLLYDTLSPPKVLHLAVASRIKVMANLNIAESRLPQDGRILVRISGHMVDLRVSTLPTIFGESIVIRILDKQAIQLSLAQIGLQNDLQVKIKELIQQPYGIILSTGPTGCGKTTTQYCCLNRINKVEHKIITVEDPVEFDLEGLIQVSVRPKINLNFSTILRYILRQDPDIIMVGEVRDAETVQMAVHASLTGHLVFTTIHTNDACSAVTRLVDMGVEPFLIASSVTAVLAQRLVRLLCPECREKYVPCHRELESVGLMDKDLSKAEFYRGKGCKLCDYSGYKGRIGIFELLVFNEDIRSLILDKASVADLRQQAVKDGMRTLREDGILKLFAGKTTVEELVNVTAHYL